MFINACFSVRLTRPAESNERRSFARVMLSHEQSSLCLFKRRVGDRPFLGLAWLRLYCGYRGNLINHGLLFIAVNGASATNTRRSSLLTTEHRVLAARERERSKMPRRKFPDAAQDLPFTGLLYFCSNTCNGFAYAYECPPRDPIMRPHVHVHT